MTDNQVCDLSDRNCEPCQGGIPALSLDEAKATMNELHNDWLLSSDGKEISREFKFKGFARAVQMANLIAWVGEISFKIGKLCAFQYLILLKV
ncbi:4a-hydroxytetrahydrobiopterin dehydratase [bacterium]|nr:4a-hydroxytetrahydrobiopterin dehydratase [bacterium]